MKKLPTGWANFENLIKMWNLEEGKGNEKHDLA